MILTIHSTTRKDKGFLDFIIKYAQEYAKKNISESKCGAWSELLKKTTNIDLDAKDIIMKGFENLIVINHITFSQIEINPNVYYTENYKLVLLCQLISEGCIEKFGYDLFDEAFQYIADNLEAIYLLYLSKKELK